MLQQPLVIVFDRLPKPAFDLSTQRDRKCETLRIKRLRGAGNIDHTQELVFLWMPNRCGRAGPALNVAAEMLQTMNLYRFRFGDRSTDGVGTNISFLPTSTLHKVDLLTEIDGARIPGCLEDNA